MSAAVCSSKQSFNVSSLLSGRISSLLDESGAVSIHFVVYKLRYVRPSDPAAQKHVFDILFVVINLNTLLICIICHGEFHLSSNVNIMLISIVKQM